MNIKNIPIDKFWTKLMTWAKTVNNLPIYYLKYAQNARIINNAISSRKWKQIILNSDLWNKNQWGFILNEKIYQITNSKLYEVINWVQKEIWELWYDKRVDVLTYSSKLAIIVSEWEPIYIFDWVKITKITENIPQFNSWIIEYFKWFSFLASNNVLYISAPIKSDKIENAYNFTWTDSQNIVFDKNILWLKTTMNWLYIFTENKIEFLWRESLQNIAWSPTFLSVPIWDTSQLINNHCIASKWDKIFYLTKNLQINTINYIPWTSDPQIWELSEMKIVWVKELLKKLDFDQPYGFAFTNENDDTIQFHCRRKNRTYNDIVIIYDYENDTWSIDTNKNYNYIVKQEEKYYWFSDINSNIYQDDIWYNDSWIPINFNISTQDLNLWSINNKIFVWFSISWLISLLTDLNINIYIDDRPIFNDKIKIIDWEFSDWEIWGYEIWGKPIWWWVNVEETINIFDFTADQWRIYKSWTRIRVEISSNSYIQNFLMDRLSINIIPTAFIDIKNKF